MAASEPTFANSNSSKLAMERQISRSRDQLELKEIQKVITPEPPFGESKAETKAHKRVQFQGRTAPPDHEATETGSAGRSRRTGSLQIGSTVKWPKKFLKRGSTGSAAVRVEGDGGRAADVRDPVRRGSNADPPTPSQASGHLCMKKPYINLHQAIQDNNVQVVNEWLKYNECCPNRNRIKDRHGFAPVHYAAKFNRPDLLTVLCEKGADVSEKTISEEYTPLHLAARFNPSCHSVDEQCDQSSSEAQNAAGGVEESHDGQESSTHPPSFKRQTSIEQVLKFLMEKQNDSVNVVDKFGITPLHLACQVGNDEAVQLLLNHKSIDLIAKDVNGDTPLHEACFHGRVEIVTILLAKIREVNGEVDSVITDHNNLGLSPFHLACREGYYEIVIELLGAYSNRESLAIAADAEGSTPLHLACQSGNADVMECLLKAGAKMHIKNHDGVTPVHIAAQFGSVGMMKMLVDHQEDSKEKVVNKKDEYRQTPLHFASEYGKKAMVEYLINEGAKVEARDIDNYTPLLTAAEFGQTEVFQLMLELEHPASLNVHNKNKRSALFLAAESNHPKIIEIIFKFTNSEEAHKICSKVDTSLNTPLHIAAKKGHAAPLKLLLKHVKSDGCTGMEIGAKNVLNKTIMHLAAENGHLHAMIELQHDCSHLVKSTDENGNTPLHLACMNGFVEVAKLLMKMGADIGARNEILWTPIDCAASNGHARVVHDLVTAKADIDPKDKLKTTPLHLAAKEGHVTAVETLIEHNASITSRDHRGYNALDWAIENGHRDVAEAIIKSPKWKYALRNHTTEQDGKETTPFRKLIQRMPDIAEMVLKNCTTANTKVVSGRPKPEEYSVTFNYEFLEDRELAKEWKDDAESQAKDKQCPGEEKHKRPCFWFYSSKRLKHPLQVMVDSRRTELLKHPLVYKLIEHRWRYTQCLFWSLLVFHVTFVAFLTAYALMLQNPFSPTCVAVSSNLYNLRRPEDTIPINVSNLQVPHDQVILEFLASINSAIVNDTANISGYMLCFNVSTTVRDAIANAMIPLDTLCGSCGQSTHQMTFVRSAAIIIILLSTFQLVMEFIQFLLQPQLYFTDLASWIKVPYIACTIIFAFTFFNSCLCPKPWQWQVGIVAVFLVWADLIFYIRKIRVLDTGIYILMFEKILKRFLRLIIFTVLLVSMFALTFHMAFHQYHPYFEKSPFATPFHALWKTLTMTTGEVDYDNLFRQPSEGSPNSKEVPGLPFPEISFILWIAFLVLMPILFTNLLVGLAVDDIKAILEAAELTRLTLRVKLILNLEDGFLNYIIRKCQKKSQRNSQGPLSLVVYPFKKSKENWIKTRLPLVRRLWRGEDYSSAEHIANVINPTQTPIDQQTQSLMRELSKIQDTMQQIPKIHDTLQQIPKIHKSLHHMQEELSALAEQVKSLSKQCKSTTQAADSASTS